MSIEGNVMVRAPHIAPGFMPRMIAICALSMLGLAACTNDNHADLANYVAEVKARKAGRIPSLPEIKGYESYAYKKDNLRDPFKPTVEEAIAESVADQGLQPDIERNKEPLEAFPLDSLQFVGHLEQEGRVWAVITAPDSMVYRVEEGNYVGQSFGRIVRISETQIDVREIVPNGLGGWTERDATLMLAE
ncbi:MAG: pilus assembly protein PilP [Pseudomonadota bacterium]